MLLRGGCPAPCASPENRKKQSQLFLQQGGFEDDLVPSDLCDPELREDVFPIKEGKDFIRGPLPQIRAAIGIDVAHHKIDMANGNRRDVCPFWDHLADELVVVLTGTFLVWGIGVAIKHMAAAVPFLIELQGLRVRELGAVVTEKDGEDPQESLRPDLSIDPVHGIFDRGGIVACPFECQLEFWEDGMDGQETGSALYAFHSIQLRDRQVRMFFHECLEVFISASDAAGLVDFQGNGLLPADPEADFPWQVKVFGIQESEIGKMIERFLTAVDEPGVGDTDMVDGLAVFKKRADQAVQFSQFFLRDIEAGT